MAIQNMGIKRLFRHWKSLCTMVFLLGLAGYFYFFCQFWTHVDPSGFTHLTLCPDLYGHRGRQVIVHRAFLSQVNTIKALAKTHNIKLVVTQGYRPPGRPVKDAIVKPAVRSNHLAGHALDMNPRHGWKTYTSEDMAPENFHRLPPRVRAFLDAVRAHPRLRWGGDFNTPDPVHIDLPINLDQPELWYRYYKDCGEDWFAAEPLWRVRLGQWRQRFLPGAD